MKKIKPWIWSVVFVIAVLMVGMYIVYPMVKTKKHLKIYEPADVNPRLVDSTLHGQTKGHFIGDFKLVDQLGDTITPANFKNKIYVANFFYTTCPDLCPRMSSQMERLQKAFADDPQVLLLSHSVTPVSDSVPVLFAYAQRYGANPNKWMLCTGPKKEIYRLARKSYFAVVTKGDGGADDFIHTENFVLVDKKKQIRGFYNGTSATDVNRLINDIHILEQEYQ